jgi:cyanophycinase
VGGLLLLVVLASLLSTSPVPAEPLPRALTTPPRIEWEGLQQPVVLLGAAVPDEVKGSALKLAGEQAKIVSIPAAGDKADLAALSGALVDRHKEQDRLLAGLGKNPDRFGIGVDEDTALIVKGRQMKVLGKGGVNLVLPAANGRPVRIVELKNGESADLTSWLRAARERHLSFPPRELPPCEVASGSLVIVGGGGMPAEITQKFIELAGGPDALIVVLPIATSDGPPKGNEGGFFEKGGAKNVKQLPARSKAEVEDPKNLALLKEAKGIWFGGGRQWRFVDSYEGTKAYPLLHDVLKRGGVIGGSSAGASIQGDYLCRGNPLGNLDIMAEGYERGFAFLPGSAIDQHFAQRKRFPDMAELIKTFPQYLGIGLDESTAILVRGNVAEVMGKGEVHFFDGRRKLVEGDKEYQSFKAGQKYDVKARKLLDR